MNGRELRVWHWRRYQAALSTALAHEKEALLPETSKGSASFHLERAKAAARREKFHRDAVTTLDDHPDCAGTRAYQDAEILPNRDLGIQRRRDKK